MVWGELVLASVGRAIIPAATKLWSLLAHRRLLTVRLEPFDDSEMLRAFSARLTNASAESLRLNFIFIRKPEGSQLAIRFHIPPLLLEDPPHHEPWQRTQRYSIDRVLDPGETCWCRLILPPPLPCAVPLSQENYRTARHELLAAKAGCWNATLVRVGPCDKTSALLACLGR
jgi:hypothetical protein